MRSEVPVTGRSTSKTTAEVQEELVEGARRVWRTMKGTATGAVIFTISKFALVASLKIKRKTNVDSTGMINTWWFVIHDSEANLQLLETKYEAIQLQTSCKLEPCFKPSHPDPDESISKVALPEVDGTNNEQEFITPVVACSGDENDTANALSVLMIMHRLSLLLFWRCEHRIGQVI